MALPSSILDLLKSLCDSGRSVLPDVEHTCFAGKRDVSRVNNIPDSRQERISTGRQPAHTEAGWFAGRGKK